jgi:competence ComEA-like helix-hairpin-helix protein
VFFAPGAYAPHSPAGRALLHHELGHVAQQRRLGRAVIQREGPVETFDGDWKIRTWPAGLTVKENAKAKKYEVWIGDQQWIGVGGPSGVAPPIKFEFTISKSEVTVSVKSEADVQITVDFDVEREMARQLHPPATIHYVFRCGGEAKFRATSKGPLTVGKQLIFDGDHEVVKVETTHERIVPCPLTLDVPWSYQGEAGLTRGMAVWNLEKLPDSFPTFGTLDDARKFIDANKNKNFLLLQMPDGRFAARAVNEDQLQDLADSVRRGEPKLGLLPEFVRYKGGPARGELMSMWVDGQEVPGLQGLEDMYYRDPDDIGMYVSGTGKNKSRKPRDVIQECEVFEIGSKSYGRRALGHGDAVAIQIALDGLKTPDVYKRMVGTHKFHSLRVAGVSKRIHYLDLNYFHGRDLFNEAADATGGTTVQIGVIRSRLSDPKVRRYVEVELDRETDNPMFTKRLKSSSEAMHAVEQQLWQRLENRAQRIAIENLEDCVRTLKPYDHDDAIQAVILSFNGQDAKQQDNILDFFGLDPDPRATNAPTRDAYRAVMNREDTAGQMAMGEVITEKFMLGQSQGLGPNNTPPPSVGPTTGISVDCSLADMRKRITAQIADFESSLTLLREKNSDDSYKQPVLEADGELGESIRGALYKELGWSLDPKAYPHNPTSTPALIAQTLSPGLFVGKSLVDAIEHADSLAGDRNAHPALSQQMFVNLAAYRQAMRRLKIVAKVVVAVVIMLLAHEFAAGILPFLGLAEGTAAYLFGYAVAFSLASTGLGAIEARLTEGHWPGLGDLGVSFVTNFVMTYLFAGLGNLIKGFGEGTRISIMGLAFLGISAGQWAISHGGKMPNREQFLDWWFENAASFALIEASGRLMRPFDQKVSLWHRNRKMKPETKQKLNDFYGDDLRFQTELADLVRTPHKLREVAPAKRKRLVEDLLPRQKALVEELGKKLGPNDNEVQLNAERKAELESINEALAMFERTDVMTGDEITPLGEAREAFEYKPGADLSAFENVLKKIHGDGVKFERSKDGNIRIEIPGSPRPMLLYPRAAAASTAPSATAGTTASGKPNINELGWKEIVAQVDGIGEVKAKAITEARDKKHNGEFKTIDEVRDVTGIGDVLFPKIAAKLGCAPPPAIQDVGMGLVRRATAAVGRATQMNLAGTAPVKKISGSLKVNDRDQIAETRRHVEAVEAQLAEAGKVARDKIAERPAFKAKPDWREDLKTKEKATDQEIDDALAQIPSGKGTPSKKISRVVNLEPEHIRALVLMQRMKVNLTKFFEVASNVSIAARNRAFELIIEGSAHRITGFDQVVKDMTKQPSKFIGSLWQLELAQHIGWTRIDAMEQRVIVDGVEGIADLVLSKGVGGIDFYAECKNWGDIGWNKGSEHMAFQVAKRLKQANWDPKVLESHQIIFRDPPPKSMTEIREFIRQEVTKYLKGAQHADKSFVTSAEKQVILEAIMREPNLVQSSKLREDPGPLKVEAKDIDPTKPTPVPGVVKDDDDDAKKPAAPP